MALFQRHANGGESMKPRTQSAIVKAGSLVPVNTSGAWLMNLDEAAMVRDNFMVEAIYTFSVLPLL